MQNKYVLMVVPNDFPNGDAGAIRDDAFSRIYQNLNYDVKLIGKGTRYKEGYYCGTNFVSIYSSVQSVKGHFIRFLFDPNKYRDVIDKWIEKYGFPSVIHINTIPEKTIRYLIKIAKEKQIPIVHDSVEWYSACEFSRGKLDKAYILKDRLNRKVICNPILVYSISTYLDRHFKSRGLESIRIPVIMDINSIEVEDLPMNSDEKVRLIYAGSPGRKDYLSEMIMGIENLNEEEKARIVFNIYGVSAIEIEKIIGRQLSSKSIIPHGRVSRDEVQRALIESDFSLLLRPENERYAQAGFPTKLVEAMAHGVSMICNLSSDLGMYLEHMNNSVIVSDPSAESLTEALRVVLQLGRDEITNLKRNARLTAEQHFDYRIYIDQIKKAIMERNNGSI